uniref:endo-glucanase chimera C10 n=1 Tax=Geobacillus sp. 70PC53 TaxID=575526 RepID=UPI000766E110|nr:Chain A, endo-glucanase chimera C10 [synthetic construct]
MTKTPVAKNGQLQVVGTALLNRDGKPFQLRGISTHGLQWFGQFANKDAFQTLRDDWKANVVRLAMYTDPNANGYIAQPEWLKAKVKEGVEAAKELGMYVIIDWHILNDNDPNLYKEQAKRFFAEMAREYGNTPNVIYEIANEPNGDVTWEEKIRPYADEVIRTIRSIDRDNLIIVGTGTWSQDVDDVASDPLPYKNIMYALHFYAGTHGQFLRDKANYALSKGTPIFVTEWGTSDASGDGGVFLDQSREWLKYLDSKTISWVNWSLCDKNEASAALRPGADPHGGWGDDHLSDSGRFIKAKLIEALEHHHHHH